MFRYHIHFLQFIYGLLKISLSDVSPLKCVATVPTMYMAIREYLFALCFSAFHYVAGIQIRIVVPREFETFSNH